MINSYRIIDANLNRVCEGLRTIEDIARFSFNNFSKSEKMRILRHDLRTSLKKFDRILVTARDSQSDFGVEYKKEGSRDYNPVTANFKRVQEGLRSIEENLKVIEEYEISSIVEKLRFESYTLEKDFLKKNIPDGLYCITASHLSNNRDNIEVVKAVLDGGCQILQYREKYKLMSEKYREAEEIRKLTEQYDALFIVNDHTDIAVSVNADGVHIGQDDISVSAVRQIGPNLIVGLSTHSPQQAERAIEEKADYIGVGPVYKTATKDDVCDPVGMEYVEYAINNVNIPYFCIGGIKEKHLGLFIEKGIRRLVMVTDITQSDEITEKVKRINKLLKQ